MSVRLRTSRQHVAFAVMSWRGKLVFCEKAGSSGWSREDTLEELVSVVVCVQMSRFEFGGQKLMASH